MNYNSIRNFIFTVSFIIPCLLSAHNPLSATYYAEVKENLGILNIYLAQGGVDHAMLSNLGKDKVSKMSQLEYKQAIVDYVKSNFTLKVDQKAINLKEGGIKLGDHQTDLKFVFEPFDKSYNTVSVDIPAFKENYNHQTIFSFNFFDSKNKLILSKNNDYKGTINSAQITTQAPYTSNNQSIYWICGIALIGMLLLTFFKIRKSQTTTYATSLKIIE